MSQDQRRFIRHPTGIPIEVVGEMPPAPEADTVAAHGTNVSIGGISFHHAYPRRPGEIIELRIPYVRPVFASAARVVWCSFHEDGFDLGVEFLDADTAFRARMVEQVCHIETYRKTVELTEGRCLSSREAAREWVMRFAAEFPPLDSKETG